MRASHANCSILLNFLPYLLFPWSFACRAVRRKSRSKISKLLSHCLKMQSYVSDIGKMVGKCRLRIKRLGPCPPLSCRWAKLAVISSIATFNFRSRLCKPLQFVCHALTSIPRRISSTYCLLANRIEAHCTLVCHRIKSTIQYSAYLI